MGSVPGQATDTNKGSPGPALLTRGTTGSGMARVVGLRDVGDAPSPRSMRCERLEAEGSVRSLYLWCDARLPNWADSVTQG